MDGGTGGQGMQSIGISREDLNAELVKTVLQPLVKEVRRLRNDLKDDMRRQLELLTAGEGGQFKLAKAGDTGDGADESPLRQRALSEPTPEAATLVTPFKRASSADSPFLPPSILEERFGSKGAPTAAAAHQDAVKNAHQERQSNGAKLPGEVKSDEEDLSPGDILFINEGKHIAPSAGVAEAWVFDADTGAPASICSIPRESNNEADCDDKQRDHSGRGSSAKRRPSFTAIKGISSLHSKAMESKIKKRSYKDDNAFVQKLSAAGEVEVSQSWVHAIVVHDSFDYIMGVVLCLNAIVIGIQADAMAKQDTNDTPLAFQVFDVAFTVVFVIELALRLCAFGWDFWTMNGWKWHLFDLFIVAFSVLDELSKLLLAGTELQTVIDSLGVLRMLRLGRIIRLVRVVRLIPALKSMVYLISASMSSFFWTGVLLIIFMYCVAVYFTEVASDLWHKHNRGDGDEDMDQVLALIRGHWGSIGQSVMSLFQAITGGDDWHNFVLVFRGISAEVYTLNMALFSLYVAFAMLVMLNLVTGVFVEGAARIAREEKESELVKHVKRLVKTIDTSGDGEISWGEFEDSLESRMMLDFLKGFEMDANQARDIFALLDQDGSGSITMEEFISASISLHAQPKLADTEILKHCVTQSFQDITLRLDQLSQMIRQPAKQPWNCEKTPGPMQDFYRQCSKDSSQCLPSRQCSTEKKPRFSAISETEV
eukprot:gb/GFBE01030996.1/.p1 GENE.gb/GFBE01030996.1/~~gb/GFBE01030996.1/.p1  ORF type:complete len:710 (+),score=126.96 gb/GFBE01030996.1/:1-2130(+)